MILFSFNHNFLAVLKSEVDYNIRWMFPENSGTPQIIHFNRVFHILTIHFGGNTPIVGNTQIETFLIYVLPPP